MHDSFTRSADWCLSSISCWVKWSSAVLRWLVRNGWFLLCCQSFAGLMVGRTPDIWVKKIEAYDVKMAMLYVLIFRLSILVFTLFQSCPPNSGFSTLTNNGPHGLSEML